VRGFFHCGKDKNGKKNGVLPTVKRIKMAKVHCGKKIYPQ
jgi:hypothetical protein